MSGLGNNSPQGGNFLKTKAGRFYLSSDKNFDNPYQELEGLLLSIDYKELVIEAAKVKLVEFSVSTKQGVFKFSVGQKSNSYGNLVSFLKNADLTKEVTFVTLPEEGIGDKINTVILVKQGGSTLKGYFKKDTPTALPRWKPVEINGENIWDKGDFLKALEAAVGELNTVAHKNTPLAVTQSTPVTQPQAQSTPVATAAGTVTKATVKPAVTQEDPDDSLPF